MPAGSTRNSHTCNRCKGGGLVAPVVAPPRPTSAGAVGSSGPWQSSSNPDNNDVDNPSSFRFVPAPLMQLLPPLADQDRHFAMPNLPEKQGEKPTSLLLFPFADCLPVVVPMPHLMTVSCTLSIEAGVGNGQGAAERGGGVFPSSILLFVTQQMRRGCFP
jgi:hypothetical protein